MDAATRFPIVGGRLCVDLVNTVVRGRVDLLHTPTDLHAWLQLQHPRLAGLCDVAALETHPLTDGDLARVRALRDAVAVVLRAAPQGAEPSATGTVDDPGQDAAGRRLRDAVAALNAAVDAGPRTHLAWGDAGPAASSDGTDRCARLLGAVAADAVDVVTGPDRTRVRECAHPDCTLLFVGVNPRRRWCSASGCGNRARVARAYTRSRQVSRARAGA